MVVTVGSVAVLASVATASFPTTASGRTALAKPTRVALSGTRNHAPTRIASRRGVVVDGTTPRVRHPRRAQHPMNLPKLPLLGGTPATAMRTRVGNCSRRTRRAARSRLPLRSGAHSPSGSSRATSRSSRARSSQPRQGARYPNGMLFARSVTLLSPARSTSIRSSRPRTNPTSTSIHFGTRSRQR